MFRFIFLSGVFKSFLVSTNFLVSLKAVNGYTPLFRLFFIKNQFALLKRIHKHSLRLTSSLKVILKIKSVVRSWLSVQQSSFVLNAFSEMPNNKRLSADVYLHFKLSNRNTVVSVVHKNNQVIFWTTAKRVLKTTPAKIYSKQGITLICETVLLFLAKFFKKKNKISIYYFFKGLPRFRPSVLQFFKKENLSCRGIYTCSSVAFNGVRGVKKKRLPKKKRRKIWWFKEFFVKAKPTFCHQRVQKIQQLKNRFFFKSSRKALKIVQTSNRFQVKREEGSHQKLKQSLEATSSFYLSRLQKYKGLSAFNSSVKQCIKFKHSLQRCRRKAFCAPFRRIQLRKDRLAATSAFKRRKRRSKKKKKNFSNVLL